MSSLAACSCGPTVKEYEYEDVGTDDNIEITSSSHKFKLNQAIVIEYTIKPLHVIDRDNSNITIGTQVLTLNNIPVDEKTNSITIPANRVNNSLIKVNLSTEPTEQSFVYECSGTTTRPQDWDLAEHKQGTSEKQDITYEYLTEAKENNKILSGDIACSYYSSEFPYEDITNLKEIRITIKDINPEMKTISYVRENIPKDGASEELHTKTEVNNMLFVCFYTFLGQGRWEGWAIEPFALWINGGGGTEISEAEIYALQFAPEWSVKYTTYSGGEVAQEYEFNNYSANLETFVTNFINSFELSFASDYLSEYIWPHL